MNLGRDVLPHAPIKPGIQLDDYIPVDKGARGRQGRSPSTLLAIYACVILVPVLLLGVVLGFSYRAEARQRGLAQGRSEALLVAQTAVQPVLDGRPLSQGLSATETADLKRLVDHAVRSHDILRLRLRNLAGQVVFSDDGSGFGEKPEDEALDAAKGKIVERLTRLNTDDNDRGAEGPESVEIYLPLTAQSQNRVIGVLELYLPYGPIDADVSAGLHSLYMDLALGLAAFYLVLSAIALSVSRGLRRQVRLNQFQADHDPLTGLPNRSLFLRRAQWAVSRASRKQRPVTLAIVDLDRFKEVNDALGHHNGDELLTQIARRLEAHASRGDVVARLGGDEFGILLTGEDHPEDALRRLRDVIQLEVQISGLPVSIDSSIGFVICPNDGSDVGQLMQRADVAMYIAKSEHTGVARYDPDLDHYDAADLGLVAELRRAISEDELVLYYQPKASIVDGSVHAVEALVRWQHPTKGLLPPGRFIPLAEQTDLIERLTAWVLGKAAKDLREGGQRMANVSVAINVSARSLGRSDFASRVIDALDIVGVDHARLVVEITETALLSDPHRAIEVLSELSAAGIGVSLDDFGVGQTSLGYLSTLPLDELKIDRIFVADLPVNPAHSAIVRSIVELGHNLGFVVIGEGVETDDVLEALRQTGCDLVQGMLIASPMPLSALLTWLSEREAGENQSSDPVIERALPSPLARG